ncbi:hypothetical protein TRFO_40649 [Tritrichomonas foetus]|uniref:E2F/DP family winged-helix DNA-binding domain-containing protein n=1 Tax=Tritrichomonas foetus TaxID=1144522 RepID=A0A1J4J0T6_9EUKA|nr:hypothetical protein TRFO_40649 [Tritrichomonas foetus]|eukprot:OHS93026.1 hypothetical protein TRFO_40649 [Tritrichomonas foetus]
MEYPYAQFTPIVKGIRATGLKARVGKLSKSCSPVQPQSIVPVVPSSSSSASSSTSNVFRQLIYESEKYKPRNITIMAIAREYNIQHRRVYDFYNLLTALGVCKIMQKGQLSWVGLSAIEPTLMQAYASVEADSANKKDIKEVFNVGSSPSLGSLAINFIKMYFYLNVDTISMRKVSKIFHDGKADMKSLERRLYLVLNFLEIIGIVSHASKTGVYKLNIDRECIISYAWAMRKNATEATLDLSLECLLNRFDSTYLNTLYGVRQAVFDSICV